MSIRIHVSFQEVRCLSSPIADPFIASADATFSRSSRKRIIGHGGLRTVRSWSNPPFQGRDVTSASTPYNRFNNASWHITTTPSFDICTSKTQLLTSWMKLPVSRPCDPIRNASLNANSVFSGNLCIYLHQLSEVYGYYPRWATAMGFSPGLTIEKLILT